MVDHIWNYSDTFEWKKEEDYDLSQEDQKVKAVH